MPVENPCSVIPDQTPAETAQATKYCSSCSHPLVDSSSAMLVQDDQDSNTVCVWCRNTQLQIQGHNTFTDDAIDTPLIRATLPTISTRVDRVPPVRIPDEGIFGDSMDMDEVPTSNSTISSPCTPMSVLSSAPTIHLPPNTLSTTKLVALSIHPHSTIPSRLVSHQSRKNTSTDTPYHSHASHSSPDPLVDITHIRVRSQGHHCLYPGAVFQGTQKSGRNSYDVTVNIVVS